MSIVTGVVFLTHRIRIIWLIILIYEYWTIWLVKWLK
jgi:hypothetical protein